MAGSGYDAMAAKCPYYRKSTKQCIHCEGFRRGVYMSVSFSSVRGKKAHFEACCADVRGWEDCDVAKLAGKKYE